MSNHFAAMPSMHAGYSLWCSLSMFDYSPYKVFRILAVAYPLLTLYCIIVTANHFFLDAVFGAACYYMATRLAPYIPKIGRGSGSDLICGGPVPTGGTFLASTTGAWDSKMDEEALLPVTLEDLQQFQQPMGGDQHVPGGVYGSSGNNALMKKR